MSMPPREKELVAIAISVAAGCKPCTDHHVKVARRARATDDEIRQTMVDAIDVRRKAADVMEACALARLSEDPDVPIAAASAEMPRVALLIRVGAAFAVGAFGTEPRAADRHAGYYYPPPVTHETYNARAVAMAEASRSARIQFVKFRDDRGNRQSFVPDEILIPVDLYERAFEIVSSMGKVDTAENNRNVHEGAYSIIEWDYLTDTNNWFMSDSTLKRLSVYWVDRIALEFGMVEDFDTFVAKFRAYMRHGNAYTDWRWVLGSQVS